MPKNVNFEKIELWKIEKKIGAKVGKSDFRGVSEMTFFARVAHFPGNKNFLRPIY